MKAYYKYVLEADGIQNDWGSATLLFEVGEDRWAIRQIEIFQNGNVLKYDQTHTSDRFGILADLPFTIDDKSTAAYWRTYETSPEEFEQAWQTHTPMNR